MNQIPTESSSALAFIAYENGGDFVVEKRPNRPGELKHPGKLTFFGGSIEDGETPEEAMRRELAEELGLTIERDIPLLFSKNLKSRDDQGNQIQRHVNLFGIELSESTMLATKIESDIEYIPRSLDEVFKREGELEVFTFRALARILGADPAAVRRGDF